MVKRSLTFLFLMLVMAPAIASAQLKVVATTEDLGSLASEMSVREGYASVAVWEW